MLTMRGGSGKASLKPSKWKAKFIQSIICKFGVFTFYLIT